MSQAFLKDLQDQTSHQVQMCLGVIATLKPLLCPADYDEDYVVVPGKKRELEGGCPAAAAVTFIAACDLLTSVLKDKERFQTIRDDAADVAGAIIDAQEAAASASRAAELTSQVLRAPHANLRPQFQRTSVGWLAYYGDPSSPESCVSGAGPTPAEALLDFDRAMGTPSKTATK